MCYILTQCHVHWKGLCRSWPASKKNVKKVYQTCLLTNIALNFPEEASGVFISEIS